MSENKNVSKSVVGILLFAVCLFIIWHLNEPKVTDSDVKNTAKKLATELVEKHIPDAKVLSMVIDKATDNKHGKATVTIMYPSGEKEDVPAKVKLLKVNSFQRVMGQLGLGNEIPYEVEVTIGKN